jgi:L-asparaginase
MRNVTLISTGGTIEKTYDEQSGELVNRQSVVRQMLQSLRVVDTSINTIELMEKDSQVITEQDRKRICALIKALVGEAPTPDTSGVVVLHGTDTLCDTGEYLHTHLPAPSVPVVLTGAMRPYVMKTSDALQNLTEAIFAAGVLEPAVYCVAHGRALRFPGVVKDREAGTFVKPTSNARGGR